MCCLIEKIYIYFLLTLVAIHPGWNFFAAGSWLPFWSWSLPY